jgi:hypothetical protein
MLRLYRLNKSFNRSYATVTSDFPQKTNDAVNYWSTMHDEMDEIAEINNAQKKPNDISLNNFYKEFSDYKHENSILQNNILQEMKSVNQQIISVNQQISNITDYNASRMNITMTQKQILRTLHQIQDDQVYNKKYPKRLFWIIVLAIISPVIIGKELYYQQNEEIKFLKQKIISERMLNDCRNGNHANCDSYPMCTVNEIKK